MASLEQEYDWDSRLDWDLSGPGKHIPTVGRPAPNISTSTKPLMVGNVQIIQHGGEASAKDLASITSGLGELQKSSPEAYKNLNYVHMMNAENPMEGRGGGRFHKVGFHDPDEIASYLGADAALGDSHIFLHTQSMNKYGPHWNTLIPGQRDPVSSQASSDPLRAGLYHEYGHHLAQEAGMGDVHGPVEKTIEQHFHKLGDTFERNNESLMDRLNSSYAGESAQEAFAEAHARYMEGTTDPAIHSVVEDTGLVDRAARPAPQINLGPTKPKPPRVEPNVTRREPIIPKVEPVILEKKVPHIPHIPSPVEKLPQEEKKITAILKHPGAMAGVAAAVGLGAMLLHGRKHQQPADNGTMDYDGPTPTGSMAGYNNAAGAVIQMSGTGYDNPAQHARKSKFRQMQPVRSFVAPNANVSSVYDQRRPQATMLS